MPACTNMRAHILSYTLSQQRSHLRAHTLTGLRVLLVAALRRSMQADSRSTTDCIKECHHGHILNGRPLRGFAEVAQSMQCFLQAICACRQTLLTLSLRVQVCTACTLLLQLAAACCSAADGKSIVHVTVIFAFAEVAEQDGHSACKGRSLQAYQQIQSRSGWEHVHALTHLKLSACGCTKP